MEGLLLFLLPQPPWRVSIRAILSGGPRPSRGISLPTLMLTAAAMLCFSANPCFSVLMATFVSTKIAYLGHAGDAERHDERRVEIGIKRSHLAPGEFAEWIANRTGRQS